MRERKILNVITSFGNIATRQEEKVQRDAYRLGRGIECGTSQSEFSIERWSAGSALSPKGRTIILLIISVLFLSNPVLAAVSPKEPIPFADFRLDWWLEILIIFTIAVIAAIVFIISLGLPIGGIVIRVVILWPILEEFVFRYILMYALYLKGRYGNPDMGLLVNAFLIFGITFGLFHALPALLNKAKPVPSNDVLGILPPIGLQVGEGLFLGMLNGLIFLNFIYFFNVGLLITMVYVWTAHIMVNLVAVVFNFIVNNFFGRNFFLHLAPRLVAGIMALVMFWYCWSHQTLVTEIF